MKMNLLWRGKVLNGKKEEIYGGRLVAVQTPLMPPWKRNNGSFLSFLFNIHIALSILSLLVVYQMLISDWDVCFTDWYDWWLLIMFQDVIPKYPTTCAVEWVDAEDPLFLLYTSGSTGKPKVYMFHTSISIFFLFFFFMEFSNFNLIREFCTQLEDIWCTLLQHLNMHLITNHLTSTGTLHNQRLIITNFLIWLLHACGNSSIFADIFVTWLFFLSVL